MPASGPVSLTRQTIYCFIPIMNWYAAYHIKKFRKYLLIAIIVELALGGIHMSLIPEYDASRMYVDGIDPNNPQSIEDLEINWSEIMLRTDNSLGLPMFLVVLITEFSVTVFFIRRWSNQWNKQFS